MITLTPITDAAKLQEYYRFRYRIYSESRQAGFVHDKEDGMDIDRYDTRARHYGWHLKGELVGCVRFVEPDESEDALPMLSNMAERGPRNAVQRFIAERRRQGEPMVEASRFCLTPEHRGLRTAKEFVLAMVRTMQPLGYEQGLFDCDKRHSAFYTLLGFEDLEDAGSFWLPGPKYIACAKRYEFAKVLARNPCYMEPTGLDQQRRRHKLITQPLCAVSRRNKRQTPNKMKTLKSNISAGMFAMLAIACTKEGPIGPKGDAGVPGQDGSANVTSITGTSNNTYNGGSSDFDYVMTTDLITQNIIDDGVVLGYLSTSAGWTPLNWHRSLGGDLLLMYRGFFNVGEYRVNMKRSDGQTILAIDPLASMNPLSLKLVVIEGGQGMQQQEIERLATAELAR